MKRMAGERETHTHLLPLMEMMMKSRAVMKDLRHWLPRHLLVQETMHKVSLSSSRSPGRRRKRSSVEKTTAVLKKAMTQKKGKVEK